jgi:hypothetical protein
MDSVPCDDAFLKLLQSVNPYINDLHPSFHRFLDLPIEFRYLVYEHYLSASRESLACNNWSYPGNSQIYIGSISHTTSARPTIGHLQKKV